MIAADTSALIAFLEGVPGRAVEQLGAAAVGGNLVLPPVVIVETLSAAAQLQAILQNLAFLEIKPGYWDRAGHNRRLLREKGLKANLGDTLIAQSCIDHDVPLITRDEDFRHFAKHCGLKLA
ncbi:MAG TPA: PIN domain-containing protein [Rhizomicrobium sp.]|nr:PIN domain-containing protein [Rhizomicrobium sp.]